jgi:hypothetical protein
MRTRLITTCGLLLLATLTLTACEDSNRIAVNPNDPGAPASVVGLLPSARPPIDDVPVPAGFKLYESVSRSYSSAGSRYIDHTYKGDADKTDVAQFYRKYMPAKGWTFRGSQMVRGVIHLRYERPTEFCDVSIDGSNNIFGPTASININLQTVGRGDPAAR